MNMKLFAAGAASLIATAAFADESADLHKSTPSVRQSMPYAAIGAGPLPLPIPIFSVGYRTQIDHFGTDAEIQVLPFFGLATHLKANILFNYYPNPNPSSQWYLGAGIGPGVGIGHRHRHHRIKTLVTFSPTFSIGQQYRTDGGNARFFQAQVSFPTFSPGRKDVLSFPLVVLNYGFGF